MDRRQTRAFEQFAAESGAELLRIATLLAPDPHTAEGHLPGNAATARSALVAGR